MNKLMLAATLALSMGAYVNAQNCDFEPGPGPGPAAPEAVVYDIVFNVRTTQARQGRVIKGTPDDPCGFEGEPATLSPCFRARVSKRFNGFIEICEYTCDDFQDGGATISVWDNNARVMFGTESDIEWDAFWRIGNATASKSAIMELAFSAELENEDASFEFDAQGFGNYNLKTGRLQNATGNFVGWLNAPVLVTKKPMANDECECVGEVVVCTGEGWDWSEEDSTIAFGTWNLKYNKAASRRYGGVFNPNDRLNGQLPFPKWAEMY